MAGLAGIIYRKNKDTSEASKMDQANKNITVLKEQVDKMMQKIAHRGGNVKEIIAYNNNNFGSILGFITNYKLTSHPKNDGEIKSIKDPFIMLDGKIYNADKIYKAYNMQKDSSKSEIEKLKELLSGFNKTIIKEFNGQFAMAFSDQNKNIYLARDFLGRKPLYYAYSNDENLLFFASEIKALSQYKLNIFELSPGHFIKNMEKPVLFRELEDKGYGRDFFLKDFFEKDEEEGIVKDLNSFLLKAIEKRIPKEKHNIKLGAWLSGGLDSSIIAALLKQFCSKVYTFAVGFKGSKDLEAARVVADHLDTDHKEYILNEDILFSLIPKTIYTLESFDAPLVRSTLGNIIVSNMSSEADFVFSGEGGDEIFAGYNYFLEFDSQQQIQHGLYDAINCLHNTALQRVDRSSNCSGVSIRLPMLDEELMDYVLNIPPKYKLNYDMQLTKNILRRLAEKYLPHSIVWRPKDKFWEGSGISNSLENKIESIISDDEFENNRYLYEEFSLRTKEELYYYRTFRHYYPKIDFRNILSFTENFN